MRNLIRVLAAALLTSALVAPAAARAEDAPATPPTPQQVVAHCISELQEITQRGVEGVRTAAAGAVHLINRLDEKGAPDRAIIRAAKAGAERVTAVTRTATAAINSQTSMCLRLLRQIQAPQPAIDAVLGARSTALAAVRTATENALGAIRSAAQEATDVGADTTNRTTAAQ